MSNITLIILGLFLLFWISCIAISLFGNYKNKKDQIFWTIGLIFVPFLSFFFVFFKKDLLEK